MISDVVAMFTQKLGLRIARFPRSFTEPLSDIYIVLVTGKFLPPSWMDRWDVGHARSRPPPFLRFTDTFSPLLIEAYQDPRLYSLVSVSGRERKSDFPPYSKEGKRKSERERSLSWSEEGRNFPSSKDFPDYASDNYFSIRGGEMSRIKTRPVVE